MSSHSPQSTHFAARPVISSWRNALSHTPPELRPILIACTLSAANRPKLIIPLVQQVLADIAAGSLTITYDSSSSKPAGNIPASLDATFTEQVLFIRKLREGLYKVSVLIGGPYCINALGAVNTAITPELSASVNAYGPLRPANALTPDEYQRRGQDLFQAIYKDFTDMVLTKIGDSSQDLVQSILGDSYGRILSETALINVPETELCLVATLVALDVGPQLKSHIYGARNVGVPKEQVQELVTVAESITQWIRDHFNDKSSL
ncbi:hypothetical protein BGZ99_010411 [Dissophora globulifera]|uniref:Carboxymuconolactone decarboxylase-like domain-containing protein n=1 Tax=Dissophora globulifera TaxID=979702 RepID=A0A9P6UM60_9FUNG|nr:hypothetical protein BGZ99_010411 [Dissophora globulifera]